MVLKIQDDDTLDIAALKYIFGELVFAPVDALLELADNGKLSKLAAYCATLTILNSVPEFIARCCGETGSSPTIVDWNLSGKKKYLYVYGIWRLGLISEEMMVTPKFEEHAGFLYDRLRCDIAHSIVSGKIQFYKDMSGDIVGHFSYCPKEFVNGRWSNEVGEIAGFACYLPNFYKKIREGVEKFITKVESGEEELHLENARDEFMYIPGFSGTLEHKIGFLSLLEKVHERFPESRPPR